MTTIVYNENDEIIGEISKSETDKGYWFAGYDNKNRTRRIIKLFKGKKKAIEFLKSKNINQLTSEEFEEFYMEKTKSLLAPMIREVLKEETNPYKGMTKQEVETWFRDCLKRLIVRSEQV